MVVSGERIPSIRELRDGDGQCSAGHELLELAKLAQGISGRSIRQVPALAWSKADEVRDSIVERDVSYEGMLSGRSLASHVSVTVQRSNSGEG